MEYRRIPLIPTESLFPNGWFSRTLNTLVTHRPGWSLKSRAYHMLKSRERIVDLLLPKFNSILGTIKRAHICSSIVLGSLIHFPVSVSETSRLCEEVPRPSPPAGCYPLSHWFRNKISIDPRKPDGKMHSGCRI